MYTALLVRRTLIYLLTAMLLALALVEIGLRLFDPWGLLRAEADQNMLYSRFVADIRYGYHPQPGHYTFSNWQAEVLSDTSRRVPASKPHGCTVVFLGDSVTFGFGVNDADTWVNLIAQQLAIHAINAGVYSYNTERVRDRLNMYPGADLYIYLFFENDGDPDPNWQQPYHSQWALQYYGYMLNHPVRRDVPHTPGFAAALADLKQRTLIIAFDRDDLSRRSGAVLIPPYTHVISRADAHADPTGNREIATAMTPIVQTALNRVCPLI